MQTALSSIDTTLKKSATFSPLPPQLQYQAYLQYQFLDEESNTTAYTSGTYLGKKKVLTIGAGIIHQQDAMRYLSDSSKTNFSDMILVGADVFFEFPFNKEKRNAITFYGGYFSLDLGPGYYRNSGVMNMTNGVNSLTSINGTGNAFPMVGTGKVVYFQTAYLFRKDFLKNLGTLQPYFSYFNATYEAFADPVIVYEGGCNWLVDENKVKVSLNIQNRPVFTLKNSGEKSEEKGQRKNMVYLMLQYFIQ